MNKRIRLFALMLLLSGGGIAVQAQIQTNVPPAKPKVKWASSAAAGLTLTSGNSRTTLATLTGQTDAKWDDSELSIEADAAYGRSKTPDQSTATTTAELLHGFVQYNWLFTKRFYGLGRVEGLHDGVADINYRASLSAGAGYYFIKTTNTDFSAEIGPGYVFQKLGDDSTAYATFRVAEKFNQALSDRARIWERAECLPQVDHLNNYIVNAEVGIEADITRDKKLSLRSYVTDTFNNEPAAGRQKNDLTWVTAIAYKF
jgi:putative salt-induced outer membrane protein YdiY